MINCWNNGKVTAHDFGGIVGSSQGWIESCKNSGSVKATWGWGRSGGIAGEQVCDMNSSKQYVRTYIKYCYNTGTADGYYAGGIVGYQGYRNNEACDIISCWSDAAMTGSITGGIAGSLARGIQSRTVFLIPTALREGSIIKIKMEVSKIQKG